MSKITIRSNVFETNSSSTHSMCIVHDNLDEKQIKKIQRNVVFKAEYFGWDNSFINSVEGKASYLFSIACTISPSEREDFKNQVYEWLSEIGVEATFIDNNYDDYLIDHYDGAIPFYRFVMHTKNHLIRYLFSDKSFVITGNDNVPSDVEINVDYRHEEFYKGN